MFEEQDRDESLPPRKELIEPPPIRLIEEIQSDYIKRRAMVRMQNKIDNTCNAYLARRAGYSPNASDKERKKLWKEVVRVRKAVESMSKPAGKTAVRAGHKRKAEQALGSKPARRTSREGCNGAGLAAFAEEAACTAPAPLPAWADVPFVMASMASRQAFDDTRAALEHALELKARALPVYDWWVSLAGAGALGLAIIFGEAGNLWRYKDKSQLWKRLGLAVIDGKTQKRVRGKRQPEDDPQRYNPERRAAIWSITQAFFFGQEAADGPYYALYQRRKAATADREGWTPEHRHRDAMRYMAKKLLSHLLAEWKSFA